MNKQIRKELASKKILEMPVYSCTEGLYLGNIRSILVDAGEYAVQGFVLERRHAAKEERILPFDAVHSFGEDGITVNGSARLERIGQSSKYIRALRHPLNIIGCRVFTTAGRTLGKAEEYRFDSITGKICGFEISPNGFFKTHTLVNGNHLVAIAGHTIMLQEDAADDAVNIENQFLSNMGNAAEAMKEKAGELMSKTAKLTKDISAGISEKLKKKDTDIEPEYQGSTEKNADMTDVGVTAEDIENGEKLLIEEQADRKVLMDADDSLT